jgi:hypothetical protein
LVVVIAKCKTITNMNPLHHLQIPGSTGFNRQQQQSNRTKREWQN